MNNKWQIKTIAMQVPGKGNTQRNLTPYNGFSSKAGQKDSSAIDIEINSMFDAPSLDYGFAMERG